RASQPSAYANVASTGEIRPTVSASCSLMIRGQSFSILVSAASIAALSGVASATAMFALVEAVLLFSGLAQPNCESAKRAVARVRMAIERDFFIIFTYPTIQIDK